MSTHVQTYQCAGGTNQRNEESTVEGTATCLASGGGGPDALGIGLGGDHTEHQREASADVLEWAAGDHVAIMMVDGLNVGDAVEVGHHGVVVDAFDAAHDAFKTTAQVPYHRTSGYGGDVEQQQLDDAARTGTAYAAEEDEEHDKHRADDGGPGERQVEKAGDHSRGGEHL